MDNLRIGICDDEAADLAQIMELVRQYDVGKQLQVRAFSHASELLDAARTLALDIVLLDIEMEPPNGYEIARELIALPDAPVVIFATKSNAYALKGYGIAVRYLQKPIPQEAFSEAMDAAIADATAHRLTLQIDGTLISLRLWEVEYIEIFGHYALVHTGQDSYRTRSTLKELLARLPQGYFVSPHKSYIVNLEHIRSASASELCMNCGARIPIGRKRAQGFNDAFYRFLGR